MEVKEEQGDEFFENEVKFQSINAFEMPLDIVKEEHKLDYENLVEHDCKFKIEPDNKYSSHITNNCDVKEEIFDTNVNFIKKEIVQEELITPTIKLDVDMPDYFQIQASSSNSIESSNTFNFPAKAVRKRTSYECPVCFKNFSTVGRRNKHFNFHFDTSTTRKGTTNSKSHYDVWTSGKAAKRRTKSLLAKCMVICNFCGKFLYDKRTFLFHKRRYNIKKPSNIKYEPTVIDSTMETYSYNTSNDVPVRTKSKRTSDGPFKCPLCSQGYSNKNRLQKHMLRHSDKRPFQCKICLKSFLFKSDFATHSRIHTGERPFQCEICLKRFTRKSDLNIHFRIHTGEKPYECEMCSRKFTQKGSLYQHVCYIRGKTFKCEVCSKQFTRKCNLKEHMHSHTGEKPFQCEICLKQFAKRKMLRVHAQCHSGETPFTCEICSKKFAYLCNLKRHEMRHTNEKSFQCEICLKKFNDKHYFKRHIVAHTAKKIYKCDFCSRVFVDKYYMKRHLLQHTNGKAYKCEICSKVYTDPSSLKRHIICHSNKKPFKCPVCSKNYSQKGNLNRHMLSRACKPLS